MNNNVSIKDIAKMAGVSIATVSRVINKSGKVAKETEEKILQIMKENNLKAKYIKPWTKTTISLDFSSKLENLLNKHFNPSKPDCA